MVIEDRKEVAFNIGVAQSYFVAGLYRKAIENFLNGNFKRCYDILNGGLRAVLNSDLKEEEKDELLKHEKEIARRYYILKFYENKLRDMAGGYLFPKRKKTIMLYSKAKANFIEALRTYKYLLFAHLRVLGYLPSKKQREMLF